MNPAKVEAHDAVVPLELVEAEPEPEPKFKKPEFKKPEYKPVEYDTKEPGPAVAPTGVTDNKGWDKSAPCPDCHPVEEVAAAHVYHNYESSDTVVLAAPKVEKTVKVTETPVPAPPAPEPIEEPAPEEMPYTPTPVPVVHPVIYDKRIIVNEIMKPVPIPAPHYVKHTVVYAPKPCPEKKSEVTWDSKVPCPECEEKAAKAKAVAAAKKAAVAKKAAFKKKAVLASAKQVMPEVSHAH